MGSIVPAVNSHAMNDQTEVGQTMLLLPHTKQCYHTVWQKKIELKFGRIAYGCKWQELNPYDSYLLQSLLSGSGFLSSWL